MNCTGSSSFHSKQKCQVSCLLSVYCHITIVVSIKASLIPMCKLLYVAVQQVNLTLIEIICDKIKLSN